MTEFKVGDKVRYNPEIVDADFFGLDDLPEYTYGIIKAIDGRGFPYSVEWAFSGGQSRHSADELTPYEENVVEHPAHYYHPSGIEVIQITKHETFVRGNILKYVLRAPYKGKELEDLKKAAEYLRMEIERVENA